MKKALLLPVTLLLVLAIGCAEEKKEEGSEGGGGGSGSTNLSSSDLQKTWTSNCTAKTYPLSTTATHSKSILTFSASGYSYDEYYYSSASCLGGSTVFVQMQSGTWTLSGNEISFHVSGSSYSDIMPYTTQIQTDMNRAMGGCGGTSPFTANVNSSHNGGHFTTYNLSCQNISLPNSANDDLWNVALIDSGILSMYVGEPGSPGFFTQGSTSGTSIDFH